MFSDYNDTTDPVRDIPDRKEIDLGNNKLVMERKGPYGFWFIHFAKGNVPGHLQGAYTTLDKVTEAANTYLRSKERKPVEKTVTE